MPSNFATSAPRIHHVGRNDSPGTAAPYSATEAKTTHTPGGSFAAISARWLNRLSEFQPNRIMTPTISNPVVSRPVISRRQKIAGPNHHLWFNHGTWWIHYTIHLPDHTKARRRRSLRTSDPDTARHLRDRILSGNLPCHRAA